MCANAELFVYSLYSLGKMRLSGKLLLALVFTMGLALLSMMYVQYQWIGSAVIANKENFENRVYEATGQVWQNDDLKELKVLLGKAKPSLPPADSLHIARKLHLLLQEEMANHQLNTPFQFALVKEDDNTILLGNIPSDAGAICLHKIRHLLCVGDHRFLAMYFPDKEYYLEAQLGRTLVPSLLSVTIIIAIFVATLAVILKQKRFSELKNDFINHLTHDFKTPLFTISMASDLIGKSNSPSKNEEYAQLIKRESHHLNQQVEKILQHAIIDSGSFQLETRIVNLHALIYKVADSFAVLLEEKQGSLQLHLQASFPRVEGDELHLYNALYNLLDNAIKYSEGSPQVEIKTFEEASYTGISVSDRGIGIPKAFRKQVFKKFSRVTPNLHKGFGLGLSYVEKVVEAHRGYLRMYSQEGEGSEFVIYLPKKALSNE